MKYKYRDSLANLKAYSPESRSDKDSSWLKLDWNESTFPLPEEIKSALFEETLDSSYPNLDHSRLKEKLSSYNQVDQNNILIYAGSDEALSDIFSAFLDINKTCLVVRPTYTQVYTYILKNTSHIIENDIEDIFNSHSLNFNNSMLEQADLIYIANPNNPTGQCFDFEMLENTIKQNSDKIFIVDEAYFEYSNVSMVKNIENCRNLIITRTFSKAFSLAGLRIGYILTCPEIIEILLKIKNIKSVNNIALKAAGLVLDNISNFQNQIKEVIQTRENLIKNIKNFKKVSAIDSHSNFVLIKAKDSNKLKDIFLKNKILVRDKSNEKDLSNCLRITLGDKVILNKVMMVLNEYENI